MYTKKLACRKITPIMSSNSLGHLFRITTWGESHGKAIGVVIDGCPAGLAITEKEINDALARRMPGQSIYTSARAEKDMAEIYSGIFEGKTTGTPISIIIQNHDARSDAYEPIKQILRPGHANFTYLEKYGVFDYRGNGRASARETACRVAAGAVAQKLLQHFGIQVIAYLASIADIQANIDTDDGDALKKAIQKNALFCPDDMAAQTMMQRLTQAKEAGDSLGGVVAFVATGLPVGLGDPIYEKLEANLAKAMLSLPASKGFEIGEGFQAASLSGSEHNDLFCLNEGKVQTTTNHAGGTLGGISTGMPVTGRVAFKPTSSIAKPQATVDTHGKTVDLTLPPGSRHDPCVAIRAVPIVEAMVNLVLADALLMNRCAKL
jgi:chorismate synthase